MDLRYLGAARHVDRRARATEESVASYYGIALLACNLQHALSPPCVRQAAVHRTYRRAVAAYVAAIEDEAAPRDQHTGLGRVAVQLVNLHRDLDGLVVHLRTVKLRSAAPGPATEVRTVTKRL